ncbi:hypothetical protein FB451DRAFT_1168139 [Mycena latifolia]|nr:hypothetical protein FB451DRAFT_1168139 [Mycena latifolia]
MLNKFAFISSAVLFLVLAQGAVAVPGHGPVVFPWAYACRGRPMSAELIHLSSGIHVLACLQLQAHPAGSAARKITGTYAHWTDGNGRKLPLGTGGLRVYLAHPPGGVSDGSRSVQLARGEGIGKREEGRCVLRWMERRFLRSRIYYIPRINRVGRLRIEKGM